eukprot:677659-Pyramimonas_sp.AAC.1
MVLPEAKRIMIDEQKKVNGMMVIRGQRDDGDPVRGNSFDGCNVNGVIDEQQRVNGMMAIRKQFRLKRKNFRLRGKVQIDAHVWALCLSPKLCARTLRKAHHRSLGPN